MKKITSKPSKKAWVVAVDMGYGHERAAYGLKDLAYKEVLIANKCPSIPLPEKKHWQELREFYETVSRLKTVPVVGDLIFDVMDYFQQIEPFYPRRDASAPNIQLKETYGLIKRGLGKHLIELMSKNPLPIVATFFQAAFAAEEYGYPNDIYCVICDADCSRTWAPINARASRIKYFAPNGRVVERLKSYGVRPENIFLTGFPLPKELVGGLNGSIAKKNLASRLQNLDPKNIFTNKYIKTISTELGKNWRHTNNQHPLTLTFAVGGAGAQKNIGLEIAESLTQKFNQNKIRLNLVVGTNEEALKFYRQELRNLKLTRFIGSNINLIHSDSRPEYFKTFSAVLSATDILWTKPSEMSFYTGLGLPIIIAPPIGSQEHFNRLWLKTVGGGITQNEPRYTDEWLFDWVNSGGLAHVAWNGFIEASTHGAYRIESIVTKQKVDLEELPLIV